MASPSVLDGTPRKNPQSLREKGAECEVGWSMANHMRAELVKHALAMALGQWQPAAGLIMHTDRGSQYGAES